MRYLLAILRRLWRREAFAMIVDGRVVPWWKARMILKTLDRE